ncbi:unnamed protein product [Cuscuta campestris]|uniref:Uncharacterized protein n=1 Tax=Cuscuta campestris TaxID=132261 RepID=A0A484KK02_9ASTE|nr:unnamed protein product [Cuscuta campestris]
MVQTRSNANVGTGVPQQGENSATGGRHPPITTGEAEALIQRVGITTEQFKEVLAALAPNREEVVGDVAGGPTGEKAGPAGSQGKKKKVRRSQKKKATKPNGKAMMADALSRLEEEDESSSFERMSAFDRLGDPKSKKPRTSAFERLQDTRSARKGDLRDTLKEKRGESTATSKKCPIYCGPTELLQGRQPVKPLFSLTYGFEARAPAETSLLSYRVETFDAQGNEENLRAELHLIDERRERAYMRAENYRRQVKSYHDQRVRPRQFKMGDWVLRKREVSRPTDGGKFAKSFEGPYIIKEVLADGTFRLQTPTGGDVPRV